MRSSEWLAAGYFAYLSIAALRPQVSGAQRMRVWGAAVAIVAAVVALSRLPQSALIVFARDWLPGVYILAGYYVTGFFIDRPIPAQEAWLKRCDAWLASARSFKVPHAARLYLELVYSGCFVLMPAGYAVLIWLERGNLGDRYWTIVEAAEFAAFASLPWFQTRPPWIAENLESKPEFDLQRLSFVWMRQTSVCMNTFPSGHAAGSVAVALAVMEAAPLAGAILMVVALSIAVASVVGRYHYAIDAVTGVFLGCTVRVALQLVGV